MIEAAAQDSSLQGEQLHAHLTHMYSAITTTRARDSAMQEIFPFFDKLSRAAQRALREAYPPPPPARREDDVAAAIFTATNTPHVATAAAQPGAGVAATPMSAQPVLSDSVRASSLL